MPVRQIDPDTAHDLPKPLRRSMDRLNEVLANEGAEASQALREQLPADETTQEPWMVAALAEDDGEIVEYGVLVLAPDDETGEQEAEEKFELQAIALYGGGGALEAAGAARPLGDGSAERPLLAEPHLVLLEVPRHQVLLVVRRCDCPDCQELTGPASEVFAPEPAQLAELIAEEGYDGLKISGEPELLFGTRDGWPASGRSALEAFAGGLRDCGVAVELTSDHCLSVGAWVRFVGVFGHDDDCIVVPGMLGCVVEDPEGASLPGSTLMIQVNGDLWSHAYPLDLLEPLEGEPVPEALERSRRLESDALNQVVQHQGWVGLVQDGETRTRARPLLKEMHGCWRELSAVDGDPAWPEQLSGVRDRLVEALRLFEAHPHGAEALELATALGEGTDAARRVTLMEALGAWLEAAARVQDELETD